MIPKSVMGPYHPRGSRARHGSRPREDVRGVGAESQPRYRAVVSVRIGIGLFTGQIPAGSRRSFAGEYRDIIALVRRAESVGFDSAWVSEHHGVSDGYLPSLLPMVAAFAEATDRVTLGTGVVLAPLHDPLRLAEDAAVVDNISGGRLILGLGLGWRREEFRMMRVPYESRRARLEDTIHILRRAWTGERFSFRGEAFDLRNVRVTPPPARPAGPPIYIGGYAAGALRRAGRLGDGYITDAGPLDDVRASVAAVDEAARAAGRDPAAIPMALMQNAFVANGDAWDLARAGVTHQFGAYDAWEAGSDTPEHDDLTIPPQDEADLRRWTPAGSAVEVLGDLRPAVEAFAARGDVDVIVRLHYPGMDLGTAMRAVELFGEHVVPSLTGS
jgi:probable F420-dependent oxidoreductase